MMSASLTFLYLSDSCVDEWRPISRTCQRGGFECFLGNVGCSAVANNGRRIDLAGGATVNEVLPRGYLYERNKQFVKLAWMTCRTILSTTYSLLPVCVVSAF